MSFLNRTLFLTTIIKDKITRDQTPLVVVLNVTNRCNLKCGYCYGEYYKSKEKDFTTKEVLKLVDDLAELGTRSITLAGGEPLIRKDIGQIISHIKKKKIECGMNTNGILIPNKLKELEKIDMVTISLDGLEEANDKNRGRGSFRKIMSGLDSALKAGLTTHINAVITRHNWQGVDWLVNFAKVKKIQVEFNFLFHTEGKNNADPFTPEGNQIRKAAKRILELKKKGAPILFSAKVYQIVADWPDYKRRLFLDEQPDFPYIKCFAGRSMIFIDTDGKTYPCMQLINNFNALDFRQVGIKKAWENCFNHHCHACYFPCFNEFNSITNLDHEVILNQIISTLKGS